MSMKHEYMNDQSETLSCPFCKRRFKVRGKMPMEITCPRCRTLLNVKNPWSSKRGVRKKNRE